MPSRPRPHRPTAGRRRPSPDPRDRANDALDSQYRSNLISISIRPKIQYSARRSVRPSVRRIMNRPAAAAARVAVLWVLVGRLDGWSCDPVSLPSLCILRLLLLSFYRSVRIQRS